MMPCFVDSSQVHMGLEVSIKIVQCLPPKEYRLYVVGNKSSHFLTQPTQNRSKYYHFK